MQILFSTLENVKNREITQTFNAAFTDYFVKIELTEKSLADKILAENIDLSKSVGAFFEGKLVGFILLGIENKIAYNGGTGVLPNARGNNLTKRMYDFILPKLNVHSHQLEVISQNTPAVKTYEKIGFRTVRNLVCFKGKTTVENLNREIEIKVLDEVDEVFPTFWNSQPSWQNSLSAVKRTKNQHKIVGAFIENELVGYLIYTETGRVKQFAVHKDFRGSGIGKTLFHQLNNKEIIITNIDQNDEETVSFLKKTGLELFLKQFEMQLSV